MKRFIAISCLMLALSCGKNVPSDGGTAQGEGGGSTPPSEDRIDVRIATYNIRCLQSTDTGYKSWEFRKGNVAKLVKNLGFEIVGFQEVSEGMVADLKNGLPEYGFHLVGRNDGVSKGESVGVAWKSARFTSVATGRFFLSGTPDEVSSPYPAWTSTDPGRNRVVAWAVLEDRASGRRLLVFATHFEVGKTDEVTIRLRSAELVASRAVSLNPSGLPFVLLGDLNAKPTESSQAELRKTLTDAYSAAEAAGVREGFKGSFNGHNYEPENYLDNQGLRIDYIYYKGNIDISRYKVADDKYDGYYPSDHCPVFADLKL